MKIRNIKFICGLAAGLLAFYGANDLRGTLIESNQQPQFAKLPDFQLLPMIDSSQTKVLTEEEYLDRQGYEMLMASLGEENEHGN